MPSAREVAPCVVDRVASRRLVGGTADTRPSPCYLIVS